MLYIRTIYGIHCSFLGSKEAEHICDNSQKIRRESRVLAFALLLDAGPRISQSHGSVKNEGVF